MERRMPSMIRSETIDSSAIAAPRGVRIIVYDPAAAGGASRLPLGDGELRRRAVAGVPQADHAVGDGDGLVAVRDHHAGDLEPLELVVDPRFGSEIQVRRRLVKEQDPR